MRDGRLRWPDGAESDQTDFLLRVARAKGWDGWVLFPTAEDTAWLVARNHRALGARYRLTTSPWDEYRCAADKRVAYRRARAQGIATPRTWHPTSIEEVARLRRRPAGHREARRPDHAQRADRGQGLEG